MRRTRRSGRSSTGVAVAALLLGLPGAAGLALVPAGVAGAAGGSCVSLGPAGSYSEYAGDVTAPGGDLVTSDSTDGSVAYGSLTTLSGDTFATAAVPAGQDTLVGNAALDVGASPVTVDHGSAIYGSLSGSISYPGGGSGSMVSGSNPLPFSFATATSTLGGASNTLGSFVQTPDATKSKTGSTLTLTGTDTGGNTNVFVTAASDWAGISTIVINAPAGAVVLINLDAATVSLSGVTETVTGGISPDDVLVNLPTTTSLTIKNDTLVGTILAPDASVTSKNILLGGGGILVSVANLLNDTITGPLFAGCIPAGGPGAATPEVPTPLLLPLAAVVVGGGVLVWRRRRDGSAA